MKRWISAPHACAAGIMLAMIASPAFADTLVGDAGATCSGLAGAAQNGVKIDSAALQAPSSISIAEKAGSPAARIAPANPAFCKVLGHIDLRDPSAPPIRFE